VSISRRIRKVVIPAAGLGIRLLPATKAMPKEMMPIAGRPLIQFAVEEAAASGLETAILVISKGKNLVAEHFRRNLDLEAALMKQGRSEDAGLVRQLSELIEIRTVCQQAPLGLADAIRSARPLVGDEPFAVILPDVLIDSPISCTGQLISCYQKHPGCIIATRPIDPKEVGLFGVLDVITQADGCCAGRTLRVTGLTERPHVASGFSHYGIFGRFILEPAIFSCIECTQPGFAGELQLTDSLRLCSDLAPLYAYLFQGAHFDAGNKLGLVQATIAYALKDPELAKTLQDHWRWLQAPKIDVAV
jgi:UTP--glucose-1-phosphate uridylyltransferase